MPRPDPMRPRDGQTDLFEGVAFAKPTPLSLPPPSNTSSTT